MLIKNQEKRNFCLKRTSAIATIPTLTLALLLSLNLSTSWAADSCKSDEKVCGTGCIAESMECKSCGGSCYYTQTTDGAVTLYGSGEVTGIDNYKWKTIDGVGGFYSGDTADTKHPFNSNPDITSVSFDSTSNFTSIGNDAFYSASSLTSITIPEGVTSIGSYAFSSAGLTEGITIPDSVTKIGNSAFSNSRITSVTFGDNSQLTSIGDCAFQGTYRLTNITIPDGVTSIEPWTFSGSKFTSITIPEGVTSIGDYAFQDTYNLKNITIPKGVTSIGDYAFNNSLGLTSITLPGSFADSENTNIGNNIFDNIYGLRLKEINCAGTKEECATLETRLSNLGYLPMGRTFNVVSPVSNCSSYTNSGCEACYSKYAFTNGLCYACGAEKNCHSCSEREKCHWDEDVGMVVDACRDGYLKKSGSCIWAGDGCGSGYVRKNTECLSAESGCGAGWRAVNGTCFRIGYTPPEAAEITTDADNTLLLRYK